MMHAVPPVLVSTITSALRGLWAEAAEWSSLIELLPEPLLRPGPRNLLWWQWLAIPVLVLLAWGLGLLFARLTRAVVQRVVNRTSATWDDALLERLQGPLALGWTLLLFYIALPGLSLSPAAYLFLITCVRAGAILVLFWGLLRSVDVGGQIASNAPWATAHPAARSLLPLGARVAKVAIVALAVVALLSEFGYPVASLIAGLGIGGLAVALAAQKTVENLFGAFTLTADQPFRVTDFVKIEDFVGTVEEIGMRSTKIRTLDRTVITLPNGKLAEMRIENFSQRDRMRLACELGLVYETTAAQMREVLEGVERVLRAHPKIWPDAVVVRFKALGSTALVIEVMAWFQTPDWGEFQLIRQEILLQFMEVVANAKTAFAFPTQTVHLVTAGEHPGAEGPSRMAG